MTSRLTVNDLAVIRQAIGEVIDEGDLRHSIEHRTAWHFEDTDAFEEIAARMHFGDLVQAKLVERAKENND